MDYALHYARLMERARVRATTRRRAKELLGYVERHRIVPGCMGGTYSAENIAFLSGEEHYVAHQLLVKIYPSTKWLAVAAVLMAAQCTGNRAYGWLRRKKAQDMRGHPHWWAMAYMTKTEEHKKKLSTSNIGKHSHPLSDEHKRKLSVAGKGRPQSAEHREKRRLAMIGNKNGMGCKHAPRTPEHCARISAGIRAHYAALKPAA